MMTIKQDHSWRKIGGMGVQGVEFGAHFQSPVTEEVAKLGGLSEYQDLGITDKEWMIILASLF